MGTAEEHRRQIRLVSIMSVVASVLMVLLGAVALIALPRPAAGLIVLISGATGCLIWAFLWPNRRRKGVM
jgi:ABC-type Mn2+/Zn2+ transport system permease subunit